MKLFHKIRKGSTYGWVGALLVVALCKVLGIPVPPEVLAGIAGAAAGSAFNTDKDPEEK